MPQPLGAKAGSEPHGAQNPQTSRQQLAHTHGRNVAGLFDDGDYEDYDDGFDEPQGKGPRSNPLSVPNPTAFDPPGAHSMYLPPGMPERDINPPAQDHRAGGGGRAVGARHSVLGLEGLHPRSRGPAGHHGEQQGGGRGRSNTWTHAKNQPVRSSRQSWYQ